MGICVRRKKNKRRREEVSQPQQLFTHTLPSKPKPAFFLARLTYTWSRLPFRSNGNRPASPASILSYASVAARRSGKPSMILTIASIQVCGLTFITIDLRSDRVLTVGVLRFGRFSFVL